MPRGSAKSGKLNTNSLQRQLGFLGNLEKPAANSETSGSGRTEEQEETPSSAVRLLSGLLKSIVVIVLERILPLSQRYGCDLELSNSAVGDGKVTKPEDRVNILQICNMMFCISWPLPSNASKRSLSARSRGESSAVDNYRWVARKQYSNSASTGGSRCCSMASMLLNGQAGALKLLVANMSNTCTLLAANAAGWRRQFRPSRRSLLDDMDSRVAYYTSAFLLERMMTEEPEKYQRMLHNLVFKVQQSENAKLLENPYLQMRGILQLSSECDSPSFQSES
ncbi:hypothetical protein R1sor_025247 [Riccia sorocarpa]|uniref:Uncharacterized protein n=1 Tax=Riccia sorocarpa TaxID=122646 RepID=A0ABD3GA25_9MARC